MHSPLRSRYYSMAHYITVSCVVLNLIIGLLFSSISSANLIVNKPLTPQQTLYIDAQAAIAQGNQQKYWKIRKQLLDYPLLPYLERSYYTKFMRQLPNSVIEAFLQRYDRDDFVKGLQFRYLAYLSTRDKETFQTWYSLTPKHWLNAQLQCRYIDQMLQKGKVTAALDKQINALWQHPRSQDKACDPVFSKWQAQDGITVERILQRIKLVAKEGKPRLIVYLTGLLPQDLQAIGRLWGQVANSAGYVSRINSDKDWHDKDARLIRPIVMLGLERLIWQDVNQAMSTFEALPDNVQLTQAQAFFLSKTIAIRLSLYDESDAQLWLDKAQALGMSTDLRDWQLSHYIRHNQWLGLTQFVAQLAPKYQVDSRVRYWQARALDELGETEQSAELFTGLAQERHYYGFKASDALELPIQLNQQSVSADKKTITLIRENAHFKMAKELFALEKYAAARYQWRRLLNELTDSQGAQAATIAYEMQWFDRGIYALAEFGKNNDVNRRFPRPYPEYFTASAIKHSHSISWLYAIARRESAFAPDTRSSANARGLMQILPQTANYLTKQKHKASQLNDPARNIALGARYLDYLSDKVSDNIILRTAAYNAGWQNVQKWLPLESMPMDQWIELIPFKETREYVKAVIAYERIYAQQLNQISAMQPSLAEQYVSYEILTSNLETGTLSAR